MSSEQNATPSQDLDRIIESATRLGVEMDEEEALQWLAAIAVARAASLIWCSENRASR